MNLFFLAVRKSSYISFKIFWGNVSSVINSLLSCIKTCLSSMFNFQKIKGFSMVILLVYRIFYRVKSHKDSKFDLRPRKLVETSHNIIMLLFNNSHC